MTQEAIFVVAEVKTVPELAGCLCFLSFIVYMTHEACYVISEVKLCTKCLLFLISYQSITIIILKM